ncbi:MAG: glycosyltransferase family 39 protein [Bacteroidia bacterium]|nr:glycosyltransferase family 39 protein [Bacteroidia bacterium]
MKLKSLHIQLLIALAGLLLFVPFLGNAHLFDWDEINFAEAAREMIVSKNYLTVQIDFTPFWEKPPLFIWMQVLSMKIFGINEFAARFPNAICGILTLLILFNIGQKLYDSKFGLLWVLAFAGSILPFGYFKSGIIDPWFNLFIFSSIYFFILYNDPNRTARKKNIILSAFFIGLGILTKGPVALLVFGFTGLAFLIFNRFKMRFSIIDFLLFILVVCFIGGFWFILQIANGNLHIVKDFILYQIRLFSTEDSGHGGFFGYHFIVLLFGVFPASVFALTSFRKSATDTDSQKHFKKWMILLFGVALILFSLVKTKIVHYSSLCYFPLTFLAAYSIYNIKKIRAWQNILFILISLVIGLTTISLPLIDANKIQIINSGIIRDSFVIGNLQANVQWPVIVYFIGALIIAGTIISLFFKSTLFRGAVMFSATIIYTCLSLLFIAPNIEKYTQYAAIEFYEKHQGKDCYINISGFKSYAHLFYSKKQIPENANSHNGEWLLNGPIDKPVYFVTKLPDAESFGLKNPGIARLYEKNGFVFFGRQPK